MRELERITARRGELDTLAEELAKQLREVQAEREELVVTEQVLNRLAEQDRAAAQAAAAVAPTPARVAGRAVLLIPHRGENPDDAALPTDCRRILAIVRAADGDRSGSGASARNWAFRRRRAGSWNRCARR